MNSVPSSKVAAAALHQVKQAAECFPASYHDTEKAAKAKVHLQVAAELLALIVEPQKFDPYPDSMGEPLIRPGKFIPEYAPPATPPVAPVDMSDV